MSSDVISMSAKCVNRSDIVIRLLRDKVAEGLEECGVVLEGHAKDYCPVRTGALRESIGHGVSGTSVTIFAGGDSVTSGGSDKHVDYAAIVEFGSTKTRAQPYMRPALENHKDEVKQIMDAALSSV